MDVDKLIILANYLDEIGLTKEADIIDTLIKDEESATANALSPSTVSERTVERIRAV
jgi:hypothetical protein